MFKMAKKRAPVDRSKCSSCGMPVSDPLWKICPRCRAEINTCGGCTDCGGCKKR